MKKGCFVKSIIILTIFVAAIAYIIQYKLDEWVIKPAKKMFMPVVEKSFKEELSFIQDSPEKDSLLNSLSLYIEDLDILNESDSAQKIFWNQFKQITSDSIITKSELEEIKKILETENEK